MVKYMHEIGLAANIINMVSAELDRREIAPSALRAVKIKAGCLTQIVTESLKFGLDVKAKAAGFINVSFIINEAPLKIKCRSCGCESVISPKTVDIFDMSCPACRSKDSIVLGGRELIIESIDID